MTEWNPTLLTYDSAFRNFADPLLTFIGSNGENKEKKRENLRFPTLHHLTHSWNCCEEDEWEHACREKLGPCLAFREKKKKVKVLVAQLGLILWDPMGCSPPGSSVHGIFQTKFGTSMSILVWKHMTLPVPAWACLHLLHLHPCGFTGPDPTCSPRTLPKPGQSEYVFRYKFYSQPYWSKPEMDVWSPSATRKEVFFFLRIAGLIA